MTSGCGVASSSCGLCASLVNSALLSVASCIPDIRITGDELIAERVFPKRQASAIEHKIFLETIGHVGLSLHGSYRCSLSGHGDRFRELAALRTSSCERSEKPWFSRSEEHTSELQS